MPRPTPWIGSVATARELRALEEAGRMFPSATKRLLTRNRRGLPAQWLAEVEAQPAYEWILARP